VTIQFAYVPYAHIQNSWKVNEGIRTPLWKWNVYKNFPSQTDVKQPIIKNHFGHTW